MMFGVGSNQKIRNDSARQAPAASKGGVVAESSSGPLPNAFRHRPKRSNFSSLQRDSDKTAYRRRHKLRIDYRTDD